jgi:hypothetical protein
MRRLLRHVLAKTAPRAAVQDEAARWEFSTRQKLAHAFADEY